MNSSAHDNRRDDRKSAEKSSPAPPLTDGDKTERRKSGEMNRSPDGDSAGQTPRDSTARKRQDKSKVK